MKEPRLAVPDRTKENSAEAEVVVACARKQMDAAQRRRFTELVMRPLDGTLLPRLANENGLLPLLHKHLVESATGSIPPDVLKKISQESRESAMRGLFLTGELLRILDYFRERGIRAIPYKGPVLAARAYGNPSLRQFEDLDIVTAQRFIPAIYDALQSLDYQARLSRDRFMAENARAIPGEYVFVHRSNNAMVELHTERTLRHFPAPPNIDQMIGRATVLSIDNKQVPAFKAEDDLLMLAVHGAKDFWARLVWVADIAELVEQTPSIDWKELFAEAGRLKATRMLMLSLSLAREMLDLKLPPEIVSQIETDGTVKLLTSQLSKHLVNGEGVPQGAFQRSLYRIRMVGGFWNGLRYWIRLLTAPAEEDWAMADLPERLSGPYAFLRPFRLWKKYRQRPTDER